MGTGSFESVREDRMVVKAETVGGGERLRLRWISISLVSWNWVWEMPRVRLLNERHERERW
jgi:hypothetical protein